MSKIFEKITDWYIIGNFMNFRVRFQREIYIYTKKTKAIPNLNDIISP